MNDQERKDFLETSMPVVALIGDEQVVLAQKQFASGSVGWHGNSKITVHGCRVQVNLILTVVGSKPFTKTEQKDTSVLNRMDALLERPEHPNGSSGGKQDPKRPKSR